MVYGGASEEHPVSVKSAREVAQHLDRERWDPVFVRIGRDGTWALEDGRPAILSPDRRTRGLVAGEEVVPLDVVLPVLHGRLGEDGAIQGLLELSGIPYAGCDVQSSALCMDKSLTYLVARAAGVTTPELCDGEDIAYPVFVKPARSGSSYGVTRVDGPGQLAAAVEAAREFDAKVLIERAVAGSEVGCAVLGDGDDLLVGEVDQITLSHGFFRIHQEDAPETGSENSSITVPAPIPAASRELVQKTAKRLYRALGCRDLARVDLFLTDDGNVVLNEVNTLPGLTSYSRYPRMMAAAGISLADVLDRVLTRALER